MAIFARRKRMARPFAFVSFGMTRAGSTLAFQLVRVALMQAGYGDGIVPFPNRVARRKINFLGMFDEGHVDVLRRYLADTGQPPVLKTHSAPDPTLAALVESGEVRAHAVFRDPRDIALSLMDMGARARQIGEAAFAEIGTLEDAMSYIDGQMAALGYWLSLPGVKPLPYMRLATTPEAVAAEILDHLGIGGSPAKIVKQVTRREFTQANSGKLSRWQAEMSAAQSAAFEARYAPFYDWEMKTPPAAGLTPGVSFIA